MELIMSFIGVKWVTILQEPSHSEWLAIHNLNRDDADPDIIHISDVQIDTATEALSTVEMPDDVGLCQLLTL